MTVRVEDPTANLPAFSAMRSALRSPITTLRTAAPESTATRLDSYADLGKAFIGAEYLGAWYNYWRTTPGGNPTVVFRGDSTMRGGSNISDSAYAPPTLVTTLARQKGFQITPFNGGVDGAYSTDWLNTHLPADLITYAGAPPKLYLGHYWMNDPKTNGAAMTPAQSVQTFKDTMALMRGTWSPQQTSAMIVLTNTACADAIGVNETWREAVHPLLMQVCRDYGVACFDPYAVVRDGRYNVLTGWLDNVFVHPNEDHNLAIWGPVADILFPPGLCAMHGAPKLISPMSGYTNPGLASGGAMTTMVGNQVQALGYLAKTTPAPIAAGTEIARLAVAGHDPLYSRAYGVNLGAFDGTNWEYIHAEVRSHAGGNLGSILTRQAIAGNVTQLHFNGGWVR